MEYIQTEGGNRVIEQVVIPGRWHNIAPIVYGYEECAPGHSFGPALRDYYLLHYIFDGCGTFFTEGQACSVRKGEIFVISPGQITTYCADTEDPWIYCWLGFTSPEPMDFLNAPVIHIPSSRSIFEQIRECFQAGSMDCRVFGLTYDLLWQLSRRLGSEQSRSTDYAVYARTHLENTYMTDVSIEGLAQLLHIDRRYLTNVFRKTYGISPKTFLMELRLERAREFLSAGYSVTDAATMAGFRDLSNFSKKYKARFNACPSEHRTKT